MRIIAGEFRSRVLKTLSGDNTRPTTDRVREAVFSRLGPYFDGGRILDLFAGSGAISLEALSRGFDEAVMVDKSRQACQVIKANIDLLKVDERVTLWQCDYKSALERLKEPFDLIYLDPPYAFREVKQLLDKIVSLNLIRPSGIIVVETNSADEVIADSPLYIEKDASYGISKVTYIRKESL